MAKKETKVQPDDIRVACADGNVKAVKWLLNNLKETGNLTIDRINDEKYGKTSLMEAARGNGYGGEKYRKIIQKLWKAYRETGEDNSAIKQVLLKKDDRHKWITLMHSAKCGDEINLNLILSFYSEMSLSDLSNEVRFNDLCGRHNGTIIFNPNLSHSVTLSSVFRLIGLTLIPR